MATQDGLFFPAKSGGFDRFHDWFRAKVVPELETLAVGAEYLKLAGVSGGQIAYGGTGSGDDLTLGSTSHATKGTIFFGANSAYNEADVRLGIGTASPDCGVKLESAADSNLTARIWARNTNAVGTSAVGAVQVSGSTADLQMLAHGAGRTATRFGLTIGSYSELVTTAGNGLIIGTIQSAPVVLGTAATERLRITSAGNIALWGSASTSYGSATRVIYIGHASGATAGLPTGGGWLYALNDGSLWWHGSDGSQTQIAP